MKEKAIITKRDVHAKGTSTAADTVLPQNRGISVESSFDFGTLVSGEARAIQDLESQGYRVKILRDTNLLKIGNHEIDIEKTPSVSSGGNQGLAEQDESWSHYLVQLVAPPTEKWMSKIESMGVDVIEPISAYGLFVTGSPDKIKKVEELDFVSWAGVFKPEYRISPNLAGTKGGVVKASVVYLDENDRTLEKIRKMGASVLDNKAEYSSYDHKLNLLNVKVDADKIAEIASLPDVRWIELDQERVLLDERSAQITAENLNPAATEPIVGYGASLSGIGLSGAGVTISIVDSGVDSHNNATLHADINGRMSFFVQTPGSVGTDQNGHGTHVAGIAVGNATSAELDPQGFLLGQGVAPGSQFGSINGIATGGSMSDSDFILNSINNNAQVMNNSWGPINVPSSYTALDVTFDRGVRDANSGTAATAESLIVVFAAGNSGPNPSTVLHNSKNSIIVGNSLNFRPNEGDIDDIRGLRSSSSRGPAVDGRILPTIVATGTNVVSARSTVDTDAGTPGVQRPRTAYVDTNGVTHNNYTSLSGTSMSAPHVSGLSALLVEWWRKRTDGRNPSPAMVKALLVNGAIDLAGGPDGAGGTLANIPNSNQGWGRVSLQNMVLQAPLSDRGPKIFSDQRHAFTAAGQEHNITVSPVDNGRPMRVTLVWTDAPGTLGSNPSLVNNLDLEVVEIATGNVFKGNVFANGFSVTGGSFDTLNNTECVYLQNPNGLYQVNVIASAIAASANPLVATPWQDFALVIDNAEYATSSPVNVVPVIDRSGSMVSAGYVDVTRASSRQFVDLMNVNDALALVSFGNSADVEYSDGSTLEIISGAGIKSAAKTEIDNIGFGGCTFMGGGIKKAGDLLDTTSGSKAIVLLSDGYDNRGCDAGNPAKPSATDALSSLSPDIPVFSCAMGPLSDQALLEQIANTTNGKYYFMPTIDDLFEIYNYVRGQVSGDSLIVNQSAMASSSRVAAFVESAASEVTFSVAWDNPRLNYSYRDKINKEEISIRLRDPRGRLLNTNEAYVRRIIDKGYVIFRINDPTPGQWYVEVSTALRTHTKYTVGGFVNSPIRLMTKLDTKKVKTGRAVSLITSVFDGDKLVDQISGSVQIAYQKLGFDAIGDKYKRELEKIKPNKGLVADGVPEKTSKIFDLRNQILANDHFDILEASKSAVRLKMNGDKGLLGSVLPDIGNVSYNLVANVTGTSNRVKFVRKDLISFVSH